MPSSTSDICLYFLALFLPPLSVFLKTGCNSDFIINIGLSILGWIPGVIHAWYETESGFSMPLNAVLTIAAGGLLASTPRPLERQERRHETRGCE